MMQQDPVYMKSCVKDLAKSDKKILKNLFKIDADSL